MNFVKIKLNLSKMQKGERVRVLLDDGAPIENVPRSVARKATKCWSKPGSAIIGQS